MISYAETRKKSVSPVCRERQGFASWSGKRDIELTAYDLCEMLEHCFVYGCEIGWLQSMNKADRQADMHCPFSPEFLNGWPYREWCNSYNNGYDEAQKYNSHEIHKIA